MNSSPVEIVKPFHSAVMSLEGLLNAVMSSMTYKLERPGDPNYEFGALRSHEDQEGVETEEYSDEEGEEEEVDLVDPEEARVVIRRKKRTQRSRKK